MRARVVATALALSGCVAVVHESGQYVDEPVAQAIAHLHASQLVTVSLADGSAIDGTYRGSTANDIVVTRRGTFTNEEFRFPFAQVKSVHYYRGAGTWVEPAPFAGPGFIPYR